MFQLFLIFIFNFKVLRSFLIALLIISGEVYGCDVDQPIHVSCLCLICGFVDIYVCLYLAFYDKINQYTTEDNCVHMSYQ